MSTIKVDGQEYPFPESLTLDEGIVLERLSGITLADLTPGESLSLGAVKGFVVIAIMRARPEASEREISSHIGKIDMEQLGDLIQEDGEVRPPVTHRDRALYADFWRRFERAFGELRGRRPSDFWRPDLAYWNHLRPGDLGGLTPAQLMNAHTFAQKNNG